MVIELGAAKGFLSEIAKASGSRHIGEDAFVSRLVTHSAEVKTGDLFCALKGRRDGALFIKEAVENGAAAVLCESPLPPPFPCLLAKSVEEALGKWAKAIRLTSRARCIAITGSVGKTGTKNALSAICSDFFRTHATKENYNNLLGVCFTLLSMPEDTELLICELGTNHVGEIKALSQIVMPSDAIITAIGRAHIEAFGTRKGIAEEKLSILCGMREGGRLFAPLGEKLLERQTTGVKTLWVSPKECYMPDAASAWAVAFAEAVSRAYGIPDEEIERRLPRIKRASERRRETEVSGIRVIDDAYNASPESMHSAFLYLEEKAKGRRVLVLGDMLELGEHAPDIHFEIGKAAALHAHLILLFGEYKEFYQNGIKSAKREARTAFLESASPPDLAKEVASHLCFGDTVLFKGAHASGAQEICHALIHLLDQERGT